MMEFSNLEEHDFHPFVIDKLTDSFLCTEHERDIKDLPSPSSIDSFDDSLLDLKDDSLHHFDESLDVTIFLRSM